MKKLLFLIALFSSIQYPAQAQGKNTLSVKGTGFEMNGNPFEYTGISFFNALYNPEFNKNSETRRAYIRAFKASGINVLRIWCQWDNARGFIDAGAESTLYHENGLLKPELISRLKEIIKDADEEGVVILLAIFSRESWNENIRLSDESSDKAVELLTNELRTHRNLVFQVWNEFDYRTVDYFKIIKHHDPARLVTNSPGYGGVLGKDEENRLMDFLSPHTTRDDNRHWEVGAREIERLVKEYKKPVVDDEPARKGTPKFGGPKSPTSPESHILHIYNVWKAGGYVIYHHDMFQTGYGTEAIPANGIPVPGFSPYHDQVFNFLKHKDLYLKLIR
jgi:hypothetical protein